MEIDQFPMVVWVVFGAIFGPMVVVAYIVSIFKACIDRREIKKRNEIIRMARETRQSGRPPSDEGGKKKPNIVLIHDEERAKRYKKDSFHSTSTICTIDRTNNALDSSAEEERKNRGHKKKNGGLNVKVTVEHNLQVPNGVEQHLHGQESHRHHSRPRGSCGSERGIDNLGSSFSDVGCAGTGGSQQAIEMDNLSSDNSDNHAVTTPSDASSWQANTDVDTVSDSEPADQHAADSPHKDVNSATRLLPMGPQKYYHPQQHQQQTKMHHGYQQHPHRPQKPKRMRKDHLSSSSHHHNEKSYRNGSLNNLTSSGENIACLSGVRVLVSSKSAERNLDHQMHPRYQNSIRRNSYAAAIDVDYDFTDASPTRSLSDDDLRRQPYSMDFYHDHSPYRRPSGDNGRLNKGFTKSTEEEVIEM